ncbi:hypothetical protein [Enterovibrio nigricans]|uniref:DUF4124 domain-containing protein n=1 Tax=Enterovibrio nigricans DSM 22720 TaxID=1121868 RepID=A0A1T4VJ50_9GAMM|nr:hypothetical protein [Enterovibrio nigricans]PKF49729.1 hypothetical protein AT251_16795 [Enterovibrio nigricans]SKA64990.1 hypothetical protein SAMN02745132_03911 [Enterovibrio nigricans DSM 22720]
MRIVWLFLLMTVLWVSPCLAADTTEYRYHNKVGKPSTARVTEGSVNQATGCRVVTVQYHDDNGKPRTKITTVCD